MTPSRGHSPAASTRRGAATPAAGMVPAAALLATTRARANKAPALFAAPAIVVDADGIVPAARHEPAASSPLRRGGLGRAASRCEEMQQQFMKRCFYQQGTYDQLPSFQALDATLTKLEARAFPTTPRL